MRVRRPGIGMVGILMAALSLGGGPALARGGFGGGGFRGGGFGGGGFRSGGFGRSFSRPSGGGFGGFSRRSSGGFGFGRRSGGTATETPAAPSARPGGFGRSPFGSGSSFGFGRSRPRNITSPPPSARPGRFGRSTSSFSTAPGARPRISNNGHTVVVLHDRYDYHPFGVWVPYGYSPWGYYGYHFWPWMFPNPYPPSYGYIGAPASVGFLGSLFATFMIVLILAVVVWLFIRLLSAFSGGGRSRPAMYS